MIPQTQVTVIASELSLPTDLIVTDQGNVLITTGDQIVTVDPAGQVGALATDITDLAEGGSLLDVAIPDTFPYDPSLYLCYPTVGDLRVVRLEVDEGLTAATLVEPVVTGIPRSQDPNTGCRMDFGPDGYLYIGTSDGGRPSGPQDLTSLAGKVLRVDAATGLPPTDNPFADRSDDRSRLIYSYGHRDIRALAWQPTSNTLFAIDQGPGREDEVNQIVSGGNYAWNPASASTISYRTDDVPMTDLTIANARPAIWNTGNSATQLSAGAFIEGEQWGVVTNHLAMASQTQARLVFLPITGEVAGQPTSVDAVNLAGSSRAIAEDNDGQLYLATATGTGDRVYRLSVTG